MNRKLVTLVLGAGGLVANALPITTQAQGREASAARRDAMAAERIARDAPLRGR